MHRSRRLGLRSADHNGADSLHVDMTDAAAVSVAAAIASAALDHADAAYLEPGAYRMTPDHVRQLHHQVTTNPNPNP